MLGVADGGVGGPHPTRNRFLSVDSQTINIDSIAATSKPGVLRDSESEDITIPQQKNNFHPNAFFFNIDKDLTYFPFNKDFGPLNLAMVHRFSRELARLLRDKNYEKNRIFHYCNSE